ERSRHLPGAPIGGVIGAADALAAIVVGSEEIVVPAALEHEGAFDRIGRASGLRPAGERMDARRAVSELARRGVEAPHVDAAPEAAVDEPAATLPVHEMVGVDGIEITALVRHEDEPLVPPPV